MTESEHLQARLTTMVARQDRFEAKLDTLEELARSTDHKLDVATTDVDIRRAHLDGQFLTFRTEMAGLKKDVAEIKQMIYDANLLARFAKRTLIAAGAGVATIYGVTSWADLKAVVQSWLGIQK